MLQVRSPTKPRGTANDRYRAFRTATGRGVVLRPTAAAGRTPSAVLDPTVDIDWGRECTASRRLAWMLLHDASGSEMLADDWYDTFSEEVVERLPEAGFAMTRDEILVWLDS